MISTQSINNKQNNIIKREIFQFQHQNYIYFMKNRYLYYFLRNLDILCCKLDKVSKENILAVAMIKTNVTMSEAII